MLDRLFKFIHWEIAVLIIIQGLLGAANIRIPWLRAHLHEAIYVHEQIGVIILLSTLLMLSIRLFSGRVSGHGTDLKTRLLARLVHFSFYSLIFLECGIGIWMMGLLGLGMQILWWHFPLPITPDKSLVFSEIIQLHALVALVLAGLIVMHASAALYHHFVLRDHVLRNML